jgi:hypothetical protein
MISAKCANTRASIASVFARSARGARKVPYLARIDHCDRQPACRQLTGRRDLVATAGFQHDAAYTQLLQTLNKGRNAALIIGHIEAFIARPQRRIQPRFAHINSDEHVIFHRLPPTPSPSLRDTGLIDPGDCSAPAFFCSGRDDQKRRRYKVGRRGVLLVDWLTLLSYMTTIGDEQRPVYASEDTGRLMDQVGTKEIPDVPGRS